MLNLAVMMMTLIEFLPQWLLQLPASPYYYIVMWKQTHNISLLTVFSLWTGILAQGYSPHDYWSVKFSKSRHCQVAK